MILQNADKAESNHYANVPGSRAGPMFDRGALICSEYSEARHRLSHVDGKRNHGYILSQTLTFLMYNSCPGLVQFSKQTISGYTLEASEGNFTVNVV